MKCSLIEESSSSEYYGQELICDIINEDEEMWL